MKSWELNLVRMIQQYFFVKTRKERIRMPEECELLNAFPDISFCSPTCPLQML